MATAPAQDVQYAVAVEALAGSESCPTNELSAVPLAEERAFAAWQQDIPREYLHMDAEELDARIRRARAQLGERVVILGHHYQRDEVIRYADFTGDSFKLSQHAAAQEQAEFVVFCGVHFMAESADILTRPEVRVVLPNMSAGCSMADMADPDDVLAAWEEIGEILGTDARVVPITYMNSAASLKAFTGRNGGMVCTSSNAAKAFAWAFERGDKVLFFPDQHLGRNTAYALGVKLEEMVVWDWRRHLGGLTPEQIRAARVILWQGHCSTHLRFTTEQIARARAEYPGVRIIVHPECRWEVVQAADDYGSTEQIARVIAGAPAGTVWGVGTEINLVNRLARQYPDKTVFCLDPVVCPCSTMYRIHPAYVAWVLEELAAGRVVNEVRVDDHTREWALVALERMLALP